MNKLALTFGVLIVICGIGISRYFSANLQLRDQIEEARVSCRQRADEIGKRYSVEIEGLKDYLENQYGEVK